MRKRKRKERREKRDLTRTTCNIVLVGEQFASHTVLEDGSLCGCEEKMRKREIEKERER